MAQGLIYAVIAVAWIAFLVPWFVARRDAVDPEEVDPLERFGEAVKIVARSSAHTLGELDQSAVTTPLTRRAVRAEIALMARTAARRRRNVVLVLLALVVLCGALAGFGLVHWSAPLVPGALLLGFLVLARFSVKKLNASLDRRLVMLEQSWDEDTVVLRLPGQGGGPGKDHAEFSIEISAPIEGMGALWQPIPVTAPTYVSKPLVPRTVRTIDLSAPEPSIAMPRTPVVAEAPEADVAEPVALERGPRAVNE